MSLHERAALLRAQLLIEEDIPIAGVASRACAELEIDLPESTTLARKIYACVDALGLGETSSPLTEGAPCNEIIMMKKDIADLKNEVLLLKRNLQQLRTASTPWPQQQARQAEERGSSQKEGYTASFLDSDNYLSGRSAVAPCVVCCTPGKLRCANCKPLNGDWLCSLKCTSLIVDLVTHCISPPHISI